MTAIEPVRPTKGSLVTLAEAAAELDVHYMTAYRYVRTGRMVAEKRGGKWWVTAGDLAAVLAEGTGRRSRAATPGVTPTATRALLVEPFTARLVEGDVAGCWDLITDALSAGAAPAEIHDRFLRAALEDVGERWARGELAVADEHRATATAVRLVGQMGPLFRRRGRRRGTVVLGAVAGDPHTLPSALLADLVSARHFDVIDLGANTPVESFVDVARRCDDLVGVGVCAVLDGLVESALADITELRRSLPDAFLVAGGPAIVQSKGRFVPLVDVVSHHAEQACDAFDRSARAQTSDRVQRADRVQPADPADRFQDRDAPERRIDG